MNAWLVVVFLALSVSAPRTQDASKPSSPAVYPPRILTQVKAEYTSAARKAKIEGNVLLRCIVQSDGTVTDVTVVRSLDAIHGLDEAAIKALKQWTFKPGTREGKPVAVGIGAEISFTLR